MILLFHIAIAIFSVCWATFVFVRPSKSRIYTTYALILLTLTSGTYLIWNLKAHVLQTCVTGLAYTCGVSALVLLASKKLARETVKKY